jgi:hypothetical protein
MLTFHPRANRAFSAGLVLLIIMALAACASANSGAPMASSSPASSLVTVPSVALVSPILSSPLPTPSPTHVIAETMITAVVPEGLTKEEAAALGAQVGTGLIVGRLFNEATRRPAGGVWLYLGEVIGPEDNPQVIFDIGRAHVTISNDNGVFYFRDVPPGRYAIVIWTPATSFLLNQPNSEFTLLFSVAANEVKVLPDLTSPIPY